ncbi:MAG: hypothetical protein NZ959_08215 [Armatimonadetes bacterium]|nr:hypothetical protein [Armatimonadota bacterium]MDW8122795.1 glucoamylase family protein [Armatimonadota bacterium]
MKRRSFIGLFLSGSAPLGSADRHRVLSPSDLNFLEMIQKASFRYFLEEINEEKGLVRDRSNPEAPASIAATGFGLTAYAIAAEKGWVSHEKALQIVKTCLRFFANEAENQSGFLYHFLDFSTGQRYQEKWKSEISSVDTTWLLSGVCIAKVVFNTDRDVVRWATDIEERIDWNWMLDSEKTLSMGWTPESGFLPYRWDHYAEHLLMYLFAIGSPTHPIPADCWLAWKREWTHYKGYRYLWGPPLFIHQYSHAFVDFRKWRDATADYWDSSVQATLANRQFCMDRSNQFRSYGPDSWGLTACDGPEGYRAYGAEDGWHDGTVAPCAAAGSLPFVPNICLSALRYFYHTHGDKLWGRYGFKDAFNLDRNWWATDWVGIDQGITVIMIENLISGKVWQWMEQVPSIRNGIRLVGFVRR